MQETNLIEQPVGALTTPIPAPAPTMTLCSYGTKLTREELARVATPAATATHKPIPHIAVVEKLIEALGFRQIGVAQEEYAVSSDGMRMFGVMDLSSGFQGCRFAIGLRNSHDKSFRLSCTVGLRVFVCENLAFHGEYAPEMMFPSRRVVGVSSSDRHKVVYIFCHEQENGTEESRSELVRAECGGFIAPRWSRPRTTKN
jgi:hypothetical protein